MAAGATNTNGKGGPLGPLSLDNANSRVIGIEAANNGVDEPWPKVQQNNYQILVRALCKAYSIPTTNVYSHYEWAPTRKIDPAGPSRWQDNPSTKPWIMDKFRTELVYVPPTDGGSSTASKDDLRSVLNEGQAFGAGANPDFQGKPWAETNYNMANNVNGIYNNVVLYDLPKKIDDIQAQVNSLVNLVAGLSRMVQSGRSAGST